VELEGRNRKYGLESEVGVGFGRMTSMGRKGREKREKKSRKRKFISRQKVRKKGGR